MDLFTESLSKLLKDNKQHEAYFCDDNCVVLAGPGSGKTATLTMKIIRLLYEKIDPPQGLACVTFNNEAVREFQTRLKLLGLPRRPNVFLGTVHSFCLSCIIRPYARLYRPDLSSDLLIASDSIRSRCLQKAMDRVGVRRPIYEFRPWFDRYRRTHVDRNTKDWLSDETYAKAIEVYESLLRDRGYIDFDDLILIALNMLENQPHIRRCLSARYPWFVVDEYQDLGYPLHRIVLCLLNSKSVKMFAVGDPDQSIYGFTGANPKYLQDLTKREDMVPIRLGLNYRSGQKIINGAGFVLDSEVPRNYRSSRGEADPGEIFFYHRPNGLQDQTDFIIENLLPMLFDADIEPKEIAILYIDYHDANVIVPALENAGIQYAGVRDQRYRRTPTTRWIEGMAQWCCGIRGKQGIRFSDICNFWIDLLNNSGRSINSENELEIRANYLKVLTGIQDRKMILEEWFSNIEEELSIKRLLALNHKAPDEIEAYNEIVSACQENGTLSEYSVEDLAGCGANANRICLSTLHSSKGLQFDVVIMPGLEDGRLPAFYAKSKEALKEARRTFYVGITRARHIVYILYSGWYQFGVHTFKKGPSRFVVELQKTLGETK